MSVVPRSEQVASSIMDESQKSSEQRAGERLLASMASATHVFSTSAL